MKLSVLGLAAGAVVLQACATVSRPVAPVESPVPNATQVAAQQASTAPTT